MSRLLAIALLLVVGILTKLTQANELFSPPSDTHEATGFSPPQHALIPFPPVCDAPPRLLDRRRNSLFPNSSYSPLESSLFGRPEITRPFGTPLFPKPQSCQPAPLSGPVSPGFQRSIGRFSLTSPVPPAVVSAHAPPWEQLPSPSEHKGQVMIAVPHSSDRLACDQPFTSADFSADPFYDSGLDVSDELDIYGGKYLNPVQRPALEWGLPFYLNGPIPRSGTGLGVTNLTQPKFYVYGDYRTALAYNENVANEQTVWASRLNLDFDLAITATERFHMFWGPLDERNQFSGLFYDNGQINTNDAWDGWDERTDTAYFEGDLGAILGGLGGFYPELDLPFAVGLIPLVYQNGIWIEDAFVGVAATIPARNNPLLDWSNFDTTFFFGFDEVTSNLAFQNDNEAANIVGFTTFIERRGGYLELGYAYLEDTANLGRSYHNLAASYTRRYLNLFSNSARVIINTGQDGPRNNRTADGVLLLLENSFLTRNPYNVIPYVNLFAGYGTPQSAARLQGPLKNTGINFETDLLTGYPILDDSANNTYGGAIGVDLLGGSFEQQLILEFAFLQTFGDDATRNASGDQYAVGARYQRPLSHTLLFRADAMTGWLRNSEDISGVRMELRRKF
ncbi:MAG: hypothetical protein GXP24_11150 [Planctomycetes bacterium]|nr:hypothetical protein [Planctomycetota bacterium]